MTAPYLKRKHMPSGFFRLYDDDIVEVLNFTVSQLKDIRSSTCDMQIDNQDLVCSRYRINVGLRPGRPAPDLNIWLKSEAREFEYMILSRNQVRLVKRPLKNWIKYLYDLVRGKYQP